MEGSLRYLFVLPFVLAGCTATQWTREGATTADLDRDYEQCLQIAKPDPAIAAAYGAFGAVGVFFGNNAKDSRIRSCLQARGWSAPGGGDTSAVAANAQPAATAAPVTTAAPSPVLLKTVETQTPAAKRLRELKSLRDQGLITADEYEEKRRAVLREL